MAAKTHALQESVEEAGQAFVEILGGQSFVNLTFSKCSAERLSIELAALRQSLICREQICWIDTSCMICDPRTKRMNTSAPQDMLRQAWMSLRASAPSVMVKMKSNGRMCGTHRQSTMLLCAVGL